MNHHTDYDNMDLDKAEQQIKDLKKLVKTTGVKVFEDNKDYVAYVDNDPRFKNDGKMEIKDSNLDSLFGRKIMMPEIKDWVIGSMRFKRDTVEKMTMSDSYYFYEYTSKNKGDFTKFIVSGVEEDSHLIQAEIHTPFIVLPNGIRLGMSTDDVVSTYPIQCEDTPTYPEKLIVSGENAKIEYTFENQTLIKIMLYVWAN